MATDQGKIKDIVTQWLEAFSAHDLERLDQLAHKMYDDTYTLHDPDFPNFEGGVTGMKQLVRSVLKSFPDMHFTIEDMVGEGDKLVVRFIARGTNASTGEAKCFLVLTLLRYVGDKVVEEWELGVPSENWL